MPFKNRDSLTRISKWLLTADVHIYDYSQHNLEPGFRLNQFGRLAERIVHEVHSSECGGIIIAGDLIHAPVLRPHVQHAVWSFIRKLAEVVPVVITVGNHDTDTKNNNVEDKSSIITLLNDIENVHIIDGEVLNIHGYNVGFQTWLPEHGLEWFEGKLDLLINHYTDGGDAWEGQEIDKSRFSCMMFGDIHRPYVNGNIVSIGNPIGHRLGDNQDGTLLVLDLDGVKGEHSITCDNGKSYSFDWVDTIVPDEFEFLRIYRPDKHPRDAGEGKYDVEVPYPISRKNTTDDLELVSSIDVPKVVNEYASSMGLSEIHEKVIEKWRTQGWESSRVNLNFNLVSMEVVNYRSIEYADFSFNGGVSLISGDVGQGKTSIIRALEYALMNDSRASNQIRDKSDGVMYVDLILEYEGVFYRIKRGNGQLSFWEGTEDQVRIDSYKTGDDHFERTPFNNIRACNDHIWVRLPWLHHWRLMYIDQMSVGLFASMSQSDRISMLSSLLGWDTVGHYNSIISEMIKELQGEIDEVNKEIDRNETVVETLSNLIEEGIDLDADYQTDLCTVKDSIDKQRSVVEDLDKVDKESSVLQFMVDTCPEMPTEPVNPYSGDVDQVLQDAQLSLSEVESEIQMISTEEDKVLSDQINPLKAEQSQLSNDISKFNKDLYHSSQCKENINSTMLKLGELADLIKKYESDLQSASGDPTKSCESCGQILSTEDAVLTYTTMLETSRDKLVERREKLLYDLTAYTAGVVDEDKVNNQIASKNEIINNIQSSIDELVAKKEGINSKLSGLYQKKSEHQSTISTCTTYQEKVVSYQKNLDSYHSTKSKIEDKRTEVEELRKSINVPSDSSPDEARTKLRSQEQELSRIEKLIDKQKNLIDLRYRIQSASKVIEEHEANLVTLSSQMESLVSYQDITSKSGVVVRSILIKCSELLSTDDLVVTTTKELSSGEVRPDLSLGMNVKGSIINYNNLSGGQLFLTDMRFMLSLIEVSGGVGLLILDEAFKYLSSEQIDVMAVDIKDSRANEVIIVTHNESYTLCDRTIRAVMDEEGTSHYQITKVH